MARNPLNFKANLNELVAADSAIVPILAAAKISTITVSGKEVSAADAPLAAKIEALGKLTASGDTTQDSAELIRANGELAAQNEEIAGKLTAAQATITASTQKVNELTSKLTTSESAVTKLTTDLSAKDLLLDAATKENTRVTGLVNAQKTALAQRCLAAGCVDLSALDKNATEAQKLEAAEKLSFDDLFKAYNGAVNAAVAKTGVSFAAIPAAPVTASNQKPEAKGRARFSAGVVVPGVNAIK